MTSRFSPKELSLQTSIGNKDGVSTPVPWWRAGLETRLWHRAFGKGEAPKPPWATHTESDRWACQ